MRAYIIRRILLIIPTLFILSIIVFLSVRFIPGDAVDVMVGMLVSEEYLGGAWEIDREALERMLGLDVPAHVQYGRWIGVLPTPDWLTGESHFKGLLQGSLGTSLFAQWAVEEKLIGRLPVSIGLGVLSIVIGLVIALPVGIYSAIRQDTAADYVGRTAAIIGMATPQFWIAIMGILVFGALLKWLPTYGRGGPEHFIMPSVVIAWSIMAGMVRLGRSSMLEILDSDYVKFARVKGLKERLILWKHALRNAMIPLLTFSGLSLAGLLNGTIVVEVVFAWPGIGRLLLEGVVRRDIPVVQATILASAFFYISLSLVVDILYAYVDPRIRVN